MKPSLTFTIPPNHVAHWRETERGVEVEMLRFLTTWEAKARRARINFHFDETDCLLPDATLTHRLVDGR